MRTQRLHMAMKSAVLLILCLLLPIAVEFQSSSSASSTYAFGKPKQNPVQQRKDDMSWVKLQKKYPGAYVLNGPRNEKRVALTFDDAPDPRYTPAILDILAQHDVCATFFIVGNRAQKHPRLVQRIQREGHTIGNHSYDHAVMSKLSLSGYRKQIWRTDAIIKNIVGYSPRFFRPPYGELLPQQVRWSKLAGYTIVNWDVDSVDWKNSTSTVVIRNIKKTLQPGSIILQHAGGGEGQDLSGTIKALPQLIGLLQSKGYELVTLPELLGKSADRPIQ
ncbi:polysaccharide deacetylase family protein [Paenibacillus harenae]|uniref:polysaccharide deacetylase family protein n=1 Tax=Paenibacillus harenae TaxID=306543 RepID=UPI0027921974|nr:polysaccharide deacetylase family protein [Paenibacillus harenae]MDQ0060678.1 peptidoglycan/xylan/chitin deacetylase (PgdA/CDA1 family) [Paenibacillus harenae]